MFISILWVHFDMIWRLPKTSEFLHGVAYGLLAREGSRPSFDPQPPTNWRDSQLPSTYDLQLFSLLPSQFHVTPRFFFLSPSFAFHLRCLISLRVDGWSTLWASTHAWSSAHSTIVRSQQWTRGWGVYPTTLFSFFFPFCSFSFSLLFFFILYLHLMIFVVWLSLL